MARARTLKTDPPSTANDRTSDAALRPATVNSIDVARRAYDFYLARGCEDGHDVEDWLQAERELRGAGE
jgi:hypothetical protein